MSLPKSPFPLLALPIGWALKQCIEEYIRLLSWKEITIIPKDPDYEEQLKHPAHLIIVKGIQPPAISAETLSVYYLDVKEDFEQRLARLIQSKVSSKKQKLKMLETCRGLCHTESMRFHFDFSLEFARGLKWLVPRGGEANYQLVISEMDLRPVYPVLREEFKARRSFFDELSIRLQNAYEHLDKSNEMALVDWGKTKNPALIVAELIYALEVYGIMGYTPEGKLQFKKELANLMNLGEVDFADLESKIRERKNGHWRFFQKIAQEDKSISK